MKSFTPRNQKGQFQAFNDLNKNDIKQTRIEDFCVFLFVFCLSKAIEKSLTKIDCKVLPRNYGSRYLDRVVI